MDVAITPTTSTARAAVSDPPGRTTLFAHLTDTHTIGRGEQDERHVDNNTRLADAVASIVAESPPVAAVIATGDLTNDGRPSDYEVLTEFTSPLSVPFLALPGNHDDRDRIRAAFPAVPWIDAQHASWVTEVTGVRIVGLDSTVPGRPGAEFDPDREAWLRSVLAASFDGVTLLAVHHPPFVTGIEWMDRSGFVGLDRFEAALAEHPVDLILCGHLHRPVNTTVAGVPVGVGLSTVQAVELDLAPTSTPRLVLDPVGYGIVMVAGDQVVTHTRYIATGAEPYPPTWADRY